MINWLEWIGVIPLLGLTGNWRGYRMGGKAIGGANMSTDMKKKFEAARASGKVDEAKAIADKTQKFNDDKKAEKAKAKEAKTIAPAAANNEKELSASDIKIKPVAAVKAGKSVSERNMAYSSDKLYVIIEPMGKNNYYVVYQHDGVAAKKVSTIGLGMEQRLKEEIAKRENKLRPKKPDSSTNPDLNKAMAKTQPKAKPVAPRKRSNDARVRKEIKELQKKLDNTKTSLIGRGQNPDNNLSVTRLEIQLDELKRSLSN